MDVPACNHTQGGVGEKENKEEKEEEEKKEGCLSVTRRESILPL